MNEYTVYALIDPRDYAIRYVGITDDVYARFAQHVYCDGTNLQKDVWITELKACQAMLIMKTLETVETVEQAREREKHWIHHYRFLNAELLNVQIPVIHIHSTSPNASGNGTGRKRHHMTMQERVIHRHIHGTWAGGLPPYIDDRYEFWYFTEPQPSEISNPREYAEHVHEYEQGQKWIGEYL